MNDNHLTMKGGEIVSSSSSLLSSSSLSSFSSLPSQFQIESNDHNQLEKIDEIPRPEFNKFEDLKITTMTLIFTLDGFINLDIAFHLVPVVRTSEITNQKKSWKCKLPHHPIPGSIVSMDYQGMTRGIKRTSSDTYFKNSITIHISTKDKNVSIKICPQKIQMCGASSLENGKEAARHTISHLIEANEVIRDMNMNKEMKNKTFEWLLRVSKGEPFMRISLLSVKEMSNGKRMEIYEEVPDHRLVRPETRNFPPWINPRHLKYLLSLQDDLEGYEPYEKKLLFIFKIESDFIQGSLEILNIDQAMVNYNYSLGFEIDRVIMDSMIDGMGVVSRYDNSLNNYVTIEIPYTPKNNSLMRRKKDKVPHHTFLVYRSGSITQSGPGEELMKSAYETFTNAVSKIYPYIAIRNQEEEEEEEKEEKGNDEGESFPNIKGKSKKGKRKTKAKKKKKTPSKNRSVIITTFVPPPRKENRQVITEDGWEFEEDEKVNDSPLPLHRRDNGECRKRKREDDEDYYHKKENGNENDEESEESSSSSSLPPLKKRARTTTNLYHRNRPMINVLSLFPDLSSSSSSSSSHHHHLV